RGFDASHLGKVVAAARFWDESDAHEPRGELGPMAGDAYVAGDRHREADSDGRAVDGGDDRLGGSEREGDVRARLLLNGLRERGKLVGFAEFGGPCRDVGASAKASTGAGYDDAANRLVGVRMVQRGDKL